MSLKQFFKKSKREQHKFNASQAAAISKANHKEETLTLLNSKGNEYEHKIKSAIAMLKKGVALKMNVYAFRQAEMILRIFELKDHKLSKNLKLQETGKVIQLAISK